MRPCRLLVFVSALVACGGACGNDAPSRPELDGGLAAVDAASADAASADAANVDGSNPARLSLEELQDPATCGKCHTQQYAEWRGSMHAYASNDPVFLAMNRRGQRETNGTLGKFCVQCHAPMAVHAGLTSDGLNIESLPTKVQGVTCYFCHNVSDVGADHFNNTLTLADDNVMRGSIKNAVDPGVHGVAYAEQHDSRSMKAAFLCGNCHDVVNQKGFALERTLAEYQASINSIDRAIAGSADSCQGCHMPVTSEDYIASVPASLGLTLRKRNLHDHRWPAVDVALTDFPDRDAQKHAVECALMQNGAYVFALLNDGQGGFHISLETTAGHQQPSGTAQDRRMWLEVVAYDAQNNVLWQSGVISEQEIEEYDIGHPKYDPQLCIFRDQLADENSVPADMFWQAAKLRNTTKSLPLATEPMANHVATCSYTTPGRVQPARLTARMLMRPVGMDVLQSLIDSGDLDASVKAAMPTFEMQGTVVQWKIENGGSLSPISPKITLTCP